MAELSAITGFIGHIPVSHLSQIGHQIGILRQHCLQFLPHLLGLVFDGRQHYPRPLAMDEKGVTGVKVGLFTKAGGECNSPIFAEMKLNG
jgi:hypothetical protein